MPAPRHSPGDLVALSADPAIQGAVVAVDRSGPEVRYQVFHDGAPRWYYESQLSAAVGAADPPLHWAPPAEVRARLSAAVLRNPTSDDLFSLEQGDIDFIPYQFRPVLKLLQADRPRLLIADEVGVGKTIEACLILRELRARRRVETAMVVCPRALVVEGKWQSELRRFGERFTPLDSRWLRHCIGEAELDGEWPRQFANCILPYSLFRRDLLFGDGGKRSSRRRKGLVDLDPAPKLDLLIVDEAHHLRNADTYTHLGVAHLCAHAETVVFLTATPVQLASDDLFTLLNLLRPDLVIDHAAFEHMAAPNPHINRAVSALRKADEGWRDVAREALDAGLATPWGAQFLPQSDGWFAVQAALDDESDVAQRVAGIRGLERMHSFDGLINRTRRRDIGEFAVRKPETVQVTFTEAQAELYDAVVDLQRRMFARQFTGLPVRFFMTTLLRQAASSLFGLAPFVGDVLSRRFASLAEELSEQGEFDQESEFLEALAAEIQGVVAMADRLGEDDTKYDSLERLVRDKQASNNDRLLVFSTFRHTLRYLHRRLSAAGIRVGLVHGAVPDDERRSLRARFADSESPDSVQILLSSEVGCEGLDYQFCDTLVNYDLPWNPMRIEQRIGRLDRYGQKSAIVAVYNLVTPGTIDFDIYYRCLMRIGVFEHSVGGCEAILGELSAEITDLATQLRLSDDERRAKLQQAADNGHRLLLEQDELEQRQHELFGVGIPNQDEAVERARNPWIEPEALRELVDCYVCTRGSGAPRGRGAGLHWRFSPSNELRALLRQDYRRTAEPADRREFESYRRWLDGPGGSLELAFSREERDRHPEAELIAPGHPLLRQAAAWFDDGAKVWTESRGESGPATVGVYSWHTLGIRDRYDVRLVSDLDLPESAPVGAILSAPPTDEPRGGVPDTESIEAAVHTQWQAERAVHRRQVAETAERRQSSLAASHLARLAVLDELIANASDDRIRRMRQSQRTAAVVDYEERLEALQRSAHRADILVDLEALVRLSGEEIE